MITTTAKNPIIVSFIAKSKPCPCCGGSGSILVQRVGYPQNASNTSFYVACTYCDGRGFITEVIEQHNIGCDCDSCKRGISRNE